MPRESAETRGGSGQTPKGRASQSADAQAEGTALLALSPEVVAALRPWLDVDAVGGEGLGVWLLSILPMLPPAASLRPVPRERDSNSALEEGLPRCPHCGFTISSEASIRRRPLRPIAGGLYYGSLQVVACAHCSRVLGTY